MEKSASASVAQKIIAVLVLAVAAWFLFKVVIGFVAGLATLLAVVVAVIALLWAVRTLR